jgi:uncharacterized membrane protein
MHFRLNRRATGIVAAGMAAAAVTATAGPAVAAPAGPRAVPPACTYRLDTRLPIPAGEQQAAVTGTDGAATFIGTASTLVFDAPFHAVVWRNGVATELPTPAGFSSVAEAINHRGDVVGLITELGGNSVPVLWRGGRLIELAHDPKESALAEGINDAGQIVGTANVGGPSDQTRGVAWSVNAPTQVTGIPTPAGFGWGSATSILADGTLVADIFPLDPAAAGTIGIGTVAGLRPVAAPAEATGTVTPSGAAGAFVAGEYVTTVDTDVVGRAVRWKNGVPETLSPKLEASATAVNSAGTTAGLQFAGLSPRAVVWTPDGALVPLPVITTGPTPTDSRAAAVTEDDAVGGTLATAQGDRPVGWHCR